MLNRLQQNKPESQLNGYKPPTYWIYQSKILCSSLCSIVKIESQVLCCAFLVAIFHKPYLTLNTAGTGSRGQKFTVIT